MPSPDTPSRTTPAPVDPSDRRPHSTSPRPRALHSRVAASVASALVLAGSALAGGGSFQSVQAGPWSDPATWNVGMVPKTPTPDVDVDVRHDVVVDAPNAGSDNIFVGVTNSCTLRTVDGADLDALGNIIIGLGQPAICDFEGGDVTANVIRVANQLHPGALDLTSAHVDTQFLWVGGAPSVTETPTGFLNIIGSEGSLTVGQETVVRQDGILQFRPTANGAAGVSPLVTADVEWQPGSLIAVAPDYPAEVGDSWDVVLASGTVTGVPAFVAIAGPYEFALSFVLPGKYTVTVVDSPYPVPGDVCATAEPVTLAPGLGVPPLFVTPSIHGTTDPGPTCVTAGTDHDQWFRVSNSASQPLVATASYDMSLMDVALEVYDGCGGNLVACGGNGSMVPGAPAVTWVIPATGDTWLRVATAGDPGPFMLNLATDGGWFDAGPGTPGINGTPTLTGTGVLVAGEQAGVTLTQAPDSALVLGWLSLDSQPFAALGGTVVAWPFINQFPFTTLPDGSLPLSTTWPAGIPAATDLWIQFICQDGSVPDGLTLSSALRGRTPAGGSL